MKTGTARVKAFSPSKSAAATLWVGAVLAASWLGLGGCSIGADDLIATVDRRRPLLASLRDSILIPTSAHFAATAASLEEAAKQLGGNPEPALLDLDRAKARWKDAALAWAVLQPIRVGPIADLSPRLDFRPTRPNLIEQGLSATDVLDSTRLATLTPSAARGLPAMEWLLFSGPADSILSALADSTKGPRRRAYLVAVAVDIRRVAADIHREWLGATGVSFAEPAKGTRYPTTQMAMEELIKGLVASLEEMRNAKVATPSGAKSGGRPQPELVEAPYALWSLEILRANLDAVEAVFEGEGGIGLNSYLESLGSTHPVNVRKALGNSRFALAEVPAPLSAAVIGSAAKVESLLTALRDLVVVVKNDVASTLGVSITFTDNDGD